jgi:hypothetical protein
MSYVVINTAKFEVISSHNSERGAKISCSRKYKGNSDVVVMSTDDAVVYMQGVPMKTVRNMMTGLEMQIPVNTPLCCDPSSETYWSM